LKIENRGYGMKKILLIFVFVLIFTLTSCSREEETQDLEQRIVDLEQEIINIQNETNLKDYSNENYYNAINKVVNEYGSSHEIFTKFVESDALLYSTILSVIELEIISYNDIENPTEEEINYYQLLLFSQNSYKNLLKQELEKIGTD